MVDTLAARLIPHENYNENTKLNDIAIIKLSKVLELNQYIQIACLPSADTKFYPQSNIDCWTLGWGKLGTNIQPDELYDVKLTIYNSSMCDMVAYGVPKIWESQICAGEYLGGKDSCQGNLSVIFINYLLNLLNHYK